MKEKKRKKRVKGFTLIELMVVLVILGTLFTILFINLRKAGIDEKTALLKMKAARAQIETALFEFYTRYGRYPTNEEGLRALIEAPPDLQGNYPPQGFIDPKFLKDPWGRMYRYRLKEDGSYEIYTLGADGEEGGEGINKDIALSEIE